MTYERGAAYCVKRGCHNWRPMAEAGWTICETCSFVRPPLFNESEVDHYEAADAMLELNLAEAEALDQYPDNEHDLRSHARET